MYSVFEQFQFNWGTYSLSWLLNWLDSILYFFIADNDCVMRAHLLWFILTSWYTSSDLEVSYIVLLNCGDYCGACCTCSRVKLFYMFEPMHVLPFLNSSYIYCTNVPSVGKCFVGLFSELIWGLSYISSTWLTTLLGVSFFGLIILFTLPVSLQGRRFFLFELVLQLFAGLYSFFYMLVSSYLKQDTREFFPFIFYLFIFISVFNLCGMLPYSLALTSHLVVTCSIAWISWGGLVLCGYDYNGMRLLSIFYPKGLSFYLVPFICAIEVISHVFRFISLALRLFSNIVAGHILLDIVSLFVFKMALSTGLVSVKLTVALGIAVVLVLLFFECAICILQAYIFAVLSCIYCRDYVQLAH